ncbi:hypothetical protein NBRC116601_34720 [Cognatishimia sp. WU-CL00825]|uniref:FAD-dependent oxidoreductase n=1 Tax=Cognatishimia sp. WU-CL00825 TaxID=3127658 RepID=UPI0031085CA0
MDHKTREYDLVVAGGGISGFCAAITAAREGIRVALIEQRPLLGGNSSSLALVPPHGAASFWHNRMAREGGILEEIIMEYANRSQQADNRRIWDLILSEWCLREPTLDLFLNARLGSAVTEDDRIKSVQVTQHSTETVFTMHAPVFLDATGDALLSDFAGAEFTIGREGTAEFGERLAPPEGDSKTLPSALYVIAQRRSRPVEYTPPPWLKRRLGCEDFPHRPHIIDKFSKSKALSEDGSTIQLFWWFSLGGDKDTIKDSEEIYNDLLAESMAVWDHLKNHCTPETQDALKYYEATWWSPFPLRRESRRVVGDYMLTEGDIFEPQLFEDRVTYGGWPVDVHPPEGMHSKEPPCDQSFVNELYSVPYRTMYSRNVSNLFLAGRCLSVSHVAMGSIRVMNSLGAAAQAVGMAAVLCKRHGVDPRKVGTSHMRELQQELLRVDHHIIGVSGDDADDLARQATVETSSALVDIVDEADDFLDLVYDTAQQVPVQAGPLDQVSIRLKSAADADTDVKMRFILSDTLGRFDHKNPVAEHTHSIAAGAEEWVDCPIDTTLDKDQLLWICIDETPNVQWAYRRKEAFTTRFAVRFEGELVPRPSHGKARIAPTNDDWFPINHNGRLPHELHDWISETVGIDFDRKVRATMCHRITPMPQPYGGENVLNGISRAEHWPNIWISDPKAKGNDHLTLKWDETKKVSEIRLTFDTDLDAPDRCYGWPREEHRFLFPVAECVRDYRVMGLFNGEWQELDSVEGNYNRHRIHTLDEPAMLDAVRVEALESNGADTTRLYEIRVY